jgi:hypothetical protein
MAWVSGGHEDVAPAHLRGKDARRAVDDLRVAEAVVVGDPRIGRNLDERQRADRARDLQVEGRLSIERQDVCHARLHHAAWPAATADFDFLSD